MPLEILTIPCLSDNYAYLAHEAEQNVTALVDVPQADPILAALSARGWSLDLVLLTHHHADHVQGLEAVLAKHTAKVIGSARDAKRLPPLDIAVQEGDTVQIGAEAGRVMDVSGHTINHLAFHFPGAEAVFTADSLMALGCGRVFEGTKPQMWDSLSKLAALPPQTQIYSGHEYTAANAKFALSIDPDNPKLQARAHAVAQAVQDGRPTVPSTLAQELETNPFLRATDAGLAARLGLSGAPPAQVFAEIRARKDAF